ncbi:type II toxin-antitoxin system VapC family toxin [Novosphingobium sp. JCM 18896]|uniref:type II toxin-antitoxin system VapC family toxin n=1 Tax=Novosphingobium sp. JCM 18896 TaxID=2989731 RepID=UPI00222136EB|nr:type II toxin-antitoxin system VapC family toxin [Novosphingobium sp. JCM 18896]MCW1430609.1 type II toxin-antitoxin system VapC family toxin [Novosphingobium sp. JCM 18896]
MIALDTNVVVRLIVRDDEGQYASARQLLDEECRLIWTVVVETGWILEAVYRWPREAIAQAFEDLMAIETIIVPDDDAMRWAIGRFAHGADFADMMHLASCDPIAREFVSFDKRLAKQAGDKTPIQVRLLG